MITIPQIQWIQHGDEINATVVLDFALDLTYRVFLPSSYTELPLLAKAISVDNSQNAQSLLLVMGGLNYLCPGASVRTLDVKPNLDFLDFVHSEAATVYITLHAEKRTDSVINLLNLAQGYALGLSTFLFLQPGTKSSSLLVPRCQWNATQGPLIVGADTTIPAQLFPARPTRNFLSLTATVLVNNAGACTATQCVFRHYDKVGMASDFFGDQRFDNAFVPKGAISFYTFAASPNNVTLICNSTIIGLEMY